jgi:lysophospholipase L1-like esterase
MLLHPGDSLLFIGDSITDCGRSLFGGEGSPVHDLGDGYVSLIHSALAASYPDLGIRVLNMGISGNTIRDLRARWESDVLRLRPTWLSIMIGINDVWRHFDPSLEAESPISLEEFSQTLDDIIRQARPDLLGLILMTPYYLETNRDDPIRVLMGRFGQTVRRAAEEHNAVFVDTQSAFDDVLAWLPPDQLAPDRVHVNQAGHMILARALLERIGFDWLRSTHEVPGAA